MIGRMMALGVLLALGTLDGAAAQGGDGAHAGHAAAAMGEASPATQAFVAANAQMHMGMAIAFTGNADVDFMRGMIPHHQGAIDMARIVLEHGDDPETRKLAEAIIAAQTREIAEIEAWLAARGL